MKKVLSTAFVIFTFFIFTFSVSAKNNDWIEHNFSIKQGIYSNGVYYDSTIEDNDYYISITVEDGLNGVFRKVSKSNYSNTWKTIRYSSIFLALAQDDDYYYTVGMDMTPSSYGILELCRYGKDSTGQTYCTELAASSEGIEAAKIYPQDDKIYVLGLIKASDGVFNASRFYTVNSSSDGLLLEKAEDYKDVSNESIDSLLTETWYDIYPDKEEKIIISKVFASEDAYYIVGDSQKDGQTKGFIMKSDLNKDVEWVKYSEEGYHFVDISGPSSSYVAVAVYKDDVELGQPRNMENVESYIYIYDEDGVRVDYYYLSDALDVDKTDISSISYQNNDLLVQAYAKDESGEYSSYLVRYLTSNSIDYDIDGEGDIEVDYRAMPGEIVSFVAVPEDGYTLESIFVTDEDGNVIYVSGRSFAMPSSAVTIHATFVEIPEEDPKPAEDPKDSNEDSKNDSDKENPSSSTEDPKKDLIENPKTGVNNYVIIGMILILSATLIYVLTRRYNIFNKIS